ncbi:MULTISPECIES: M23 family metallopeptidase [unclassified Streptomyces]|uniref:M23 family metallopeptidase n=1 Tax=unclassified Streptomyces TaxID=2593676 RepID=UPI003830189C
MHSLRRRPLLVTVLLCAGAVLVARPTTGDGRTEGGDGRGGAGTGAGARVATLYEEAADASRRYEAGRVEAAERRRAARLLERRLARERREAAALREELGRLARAQYRDSGGLSAAAQAVLAHGPEELMRHEHVFSRSNGAVEHAVERSRAAEAALAADEARAVRAWQALERRTARLAVLKKDIESKLDEARRRLQGQADAAVTAGACRGAERLDQPPLTDRRAWVAPVDGATLSAAFGSGGDHWANRHTGQDFAVPIGTPVKAVGAGRVVRVSCGGPFGIAVVLRHTDGSFTQYAHLASVAVDQGERVAAGRWIGQSGTSGNSTGPHLHFEARVTAETGSAVDPVPWLADRGVPVG